MLFGRIEYIQIVNKGKTVMVNLEHSNQKLIEIRANVKKLTYQDLSSKKMAGYDVITSTQHAWEHIFLKDKFITVCEMGGLVEELAEHGYEIRIKPFYHYVPLEAFLMIKGYCYDNR